MAVTPYVRSLSTAFGGAVHAGNLQNEIAENPNITTSMYAGAPISTDTGTDTVTLRFDAALSTAEETELDTVVIPAHVGIPSPTKIFRYVEHPNLWDSGLAPVDLNYKTGLNRRLHAKRTIILGEVTKVEWFADYDPDTKVFSDLILTVDVAYVRDGMGLANYRTTTRTWKREDETDAEPTKITSKFYLGQDRTDELERRAKNALSMQNTIGLGAIIVDQMTNHGKSQAEAVAIGLGYADQWYLWFENEIRQFQSTNSRSFFDAIQALTPPDLQWAHDTPGFLAAVAAEVNFGGWS